MNRIDGPTAAPGGLFTEGDPIGGVAATIVSAAWMNDVQEELISVLLAAGITPVKGTQNQILAAIRAISPGVVGGIRNGKMNVSTASASATFTADQLVVANSLSGSSFRLNSFSSVINLAVTGVGGMDTGAAPTNGWVAIYAIFNPTTAARALLAVNATSSIAPEIYGGANMPAGYTASALVSVWGTTPAGLLQIGKQQDRSISVALVQVLSITTTQPSFTSINISAGAPRNATEVSIVMNASTSASASIATYASPDGVVDAQQLLASGTVQSIGSIRNVKILSPQAIFTRFTASAGTVTLLVSVGEYKF